MGAFRRVSVVLTAVFLASWTLEARADQAPPNPPFEGYYFETAASLSCIYQLVTPTNGCNPNSPLNQNTTLGSHAIAVVVPYHYTSVASDLAAYSTQFGLPAPSLTIVTASGATTCSNMSDQDVESSQGGYVDFSCFHRGTDALEVAHAMAPAATLFLVEMSANTLTAMQTAVDTATQRVAGAGGGEVIVEAAFAEDSSQTSAESHFTSTKGVIYFAPAGDISLGYAYPAGGFVSYPGSSPNVVSVGASTTARIMDNSTTTGQFRTEYAVPEVSGGFSTVFAAPSYQNNLAARLNNPGKRAVPDVAANANANGTVWVYNNGSWNYGSSEFIAAGIVAGIANAAHATDYNLTTASELTYMYGKLGTTAFFDVAGGDCGDYDGNFATAVTRGNAATQYDICTGLGTPRGVLGFGH